MVVIWIGGRDDRSVFCGRLVLIFAFSDGVQLLVCILEVFVSGDAVVAFDIIHKRAKLRTNLQ